MKKIILFLSIVVILPFNVVLGQQDTLLFHYRRMAIKYQQQIKMAQHGLEGAQSKLDAAKAGFAPRFDLKGNYNYYGVPLHVAPSADAPPGNIGTDIHHWYGLDLTVTQPILTGGYLKNTRLSAESEVEAMKNYVKLSEQGVIINADKVYLTAVAKKEIKQLSVAYRDIIGEFVKVIQDKVDEEAVGKNELYQAKVRYNDAQYQVLRSDKEFKMSIMDLNRWMGLPVDTVPLIADSLPEPRFVFSDDNLVRKALSQRPEFGYLKSKVMANQYKEKVTIAKYKPQFNVLAGGKWGSPSPGLNIEPGFNYYLKAQLNIPIFYWGQKHKEAFAIKQITEIAKLQIDETKDKVVLEVQQSYYNLKKSQEQMKFAAGALKNAQNNVSVMLDRYEEGLSSVLEVLDAQLFLQKSYFNYIQAKFEANVAYSEYLHALGVLTPENIQQ